MSVDIEAKTRLEAAEFVAMQAVAEAELRTQSNLLTPAELALELRRMSADWDRRATDLDKSGDHRASYALIRSAQRLREAAREIEYRGRP